MIICFHFYFLTIFFASDVHSKIYDIERDEWIENYDTKPKKKKKRAPSHAQSVCDEASGI